MEKLKMWFWDAILRLWIFVLQLFKEFPSERELEEERKQREKENEPYIKAAIEEETKTAKYFKEFLMDGLPPYLGDFRLYFRPLPIVKEEIRKYVYYENSQEIRLAGNPYSDQLILFGLKTLDLLSAIDGLDMLLERVIDENTLAKEELVVDMKTFRFKNPDLQGWAIFEVAAMIHDYDWPEYKDQKRAKIVLQWILEVLEYKPLLLERFKARYSNNFIQLVPDPADTKGKPLEFASHRWKVTRRPGSQTYSNTGEEQ